MKTPCQISRSVENFTAVDRICTYLARISFYLSGRQRTYSAGYCNKKLLGRVLCCVVCIYWTLKIGGKAIQPGNTFFCLACGNNSVEENINAQYNLRTDIRGFTAQHSLLFRFQYMYGVHGRQTFSHRGKFQIVPECTYVSFWSLLMQRERERKRKRKRERDSRWWNWN